MSMPQFNEQDLLVVFLGIALTVVSYLYWKALRTESKSRFRPYDILIVTWVVIYFVARFSAVFLDFHLYTKSNLIELFSPMDLNFSGWLIVLVPLVVVCFFHQNVEFVAINKKNILWSVIFGEAVAAIYYSYVLLRQVFLNDGLLAANSLTLGLIVWLLVNVAWQTYYYIWANRRPIKPLSAIIICGLGIFICAALYATQSPEGVDLVRYLLLQLFGWTFAIYSYLAVPQERK